MMSWHLPNGKDYHPCKFPSFRLYFAQKFHVTGPVSRRQQPSQSRLKPKLEDLVGLEIFLLEMSQQVLQGGDSLPPAKVQVNGGSDCSYGKSLLISELVFVSDILDLSLSPHRSLRVTLIGRLGAARKLICQRPSTQQSLSKMCWQL